MDISADSEYENQVVEKYPNHHKCHEVAHQTDHDYLSEINKVRTCLES